MLADARLSHVEPFGGAGEVADFNEAAETP